jgi:predicted Zn-dependent protease
MLRCGLILLTGASFALGQLSPDREIRMGREMAARQSFLPDPEVVTFFESVAQKLASKESLRVPMRLGVVSTERGVASALPGGYVLISAGAIREATTEAEAAALLAHAIGHLQAGLSSKIVKSVPIFFLGEFGSCTRVTKGVPRALVPQQLLGSPDQEAEADLIALQLLTRAGYDPDALVSVFDRWAARSAPATAVREQAAALRIGTQVVDTSAFGRIRARLLAIAPPSRVPRSLSRP